MNKNVLKKNLIASYISQGYVSLVGILFMPLYPKYLGAEVYGLISFFFMLHVWFSLLDFGLSQTISREMASYLGGVNSKSHFDSLYKTLLRVMLSVGFVASIILILTSDIISNKWLSYKYLDTSGVSLAIKFMIITIFFRWMGGLYRGIISGAENLVWLGLFNILISTLRFIVVFLATVLFKLEFIYFFIFQIIVSVIELLILVYKSKKTLEKVELTKHSPSEIAVLSAVRFSLAIGFTSLVWVVLTQLDKLILSGLLNLEEYGYFSLAVMAAGGIILIGTPISGSIMPRMALLFSENNQIEMIDVYRKATQITAITCGTVAILISLLPTQALYIWTGDMQLSLQASNILRLYAIGNGFLVFSGFIYYIQYAIGNIRYHLIGNVLLILIQLPLIVWFTKLHGSMGASIVWMTTNIAYFFIWVPYSYRKIFPNLFLKWLVGDILRIILPQALVVVILMSFWNWKELNRIHTFIGVMVIAFIALIVSLLTSNVFLNYIKIRKK